MTETGQMDNMNLSFFQFACDMWVTINLVSIFVRFCDMDSYCENATVSVFHMQAANDLVFFENNYVQSSDDFAPEDLGPDTPKTAVLGCVTIAFLS